MVKFKKRKARPSSQRILFLVVPILKAILSSSKQSSVDAVTDASVLPTNSINEYDRIQRLSSLNQNNPDNRPTTSTISHTITGTNRNGDHNDHTNTYTNIKTSTGAHPHNDEHTLFHNTHRLHFHTLRANNHMMSSYYASVPVTVHSHDWKWIIGTSIFQEQEPIPTTIQSKTKSFTIFRRNQSSNNNNNTNQTYQLNDNQIQIIQKYQTKASSTSININKNIDEGKSNQEIIYIIPNNTQQTSTTSTTTISSSLNHNLFKTNEYYNVEHSSSNGHRQQKQNTSNNNNNNNNNNNYYNQQQDEQEGLDPSSIGWTPLTYPNPLRQPQSCHIDNLILLSSSLGEHDNSNGNNSEEDESITNTNNAERLLLCDPDQIINYNNLNELARALHDFTLRHEHGDITTTENTTTTAPNSKVTSSFSSSLFPSLVPVLSSVSFKVKELLSNFNSHRMWNKITPTNQIHPFDQKQKDCSDASDTTTTTTTCITSIKPVTTTASITKSNLVTSSLSSSSSLSSLNHTPQTATVEIGIAIVRSMDVGAIFHEYSFFTFEDEEDMVNDAAQYFARYLHSQWWKGQQQQQQDEDGKTTTNDNKDNENTGSSSNKNEYTTSPSQKNKLSNQIPPDSTNGILIFLSVQDHVCFISAGVDVSQILPWWRLEHVVNNMKPNLRIHQYTEALLGAIHDISEMMDIGPPTISEKTQDFFSRFGIVLAFSVCTFLGALCGEYRDKRRRWRCAEEQSMMDDATKLNAKRLQQDFKTECCPICLEDFNNNSNNSDEIDGLKRIDSYGIPLLGNDNLPLKILRCGHIFDMSCWKCWVYSGYGNPCRCPVCRQDISSKKKESRSRNTHRLGNFVRDNLRSNNGTERINNERRSHNMTTYGTNNISANTLSSLDLSEDHLLVDEQQPLLLRQRDADSDEDDRVLRISVYYR